MPAGGDAKPGDTVAVESPAYYLMLQLLETMGLRALEIPTDPRHGLSVEALDLATRQGNIAACLLVSNGSNPLGCVMPDERKHQLAKLAAAAMWQLSKTIFMVTCILARYGRGRSRPSIRLVMSYSVPLLQKPVALAAHRFRCGRAPTVGNCLAEDHHQWRHQSDYTTCVGRVSGIRCLRAPSAHLAPSLRTPSRIDAAGCQSLLSACYKDCAATGGVCAVGRVAGTYRYKHPLRAGNCRKTGLRTRRFVFGERHVSQLSAHQLRQSGYAGNRRCGAASGSLVFR